MIIQIEFLLIKNYSDTSITKYKLISSKFDRFYHGSDKQYYSHALSILP